MPLLTLCMFTLVSTIVASFFECAAYGQPSLCLLSLITRTAFLFFWLGFLFGGTFESFREFRRREEVV